MKTIKISLLTFIFLTFSCQSLYSELKEGDVIGNLQLQIAKNFRQGSGRDESLVLIQPGISILVSNNSMINIGLMYGSAPMPSQYYGSLEETSVYGFSAGYGYINEISNSFYFGVLFDGIFTYEDYYRDGDYPYYSGYSNFNRSIGIEINPAIYYAVTERLLFSAEIGILSYSYSGFPDRAHVHSLSLNFGTVSLGVNYELN